MDAAVTHLKSPRRRKRRRKKKKRRRRRRKMIRRRRRVKKITFLTTSSSLQMEGIPRRIMTLKEIDAILEEGLPEEMNELRKKKREAPYNEKQKILLVGEEEKQENQGEEEWF